MPPKKSRGHGWKRRPQRSAAIFDAMPPLEEVCLPSLLLLSLHLLVVELLMSGVAGARRGAAQDAQDGQLPRIFRARAGAAVPAQSACTHCTASEKTTTTQVQCMCKLVDHCSWPWAYM